MEVKKTDSLWGNIFKLGKKDEEALDILRKVPIFEHLSGRELLAIENILHRREYATDEVVFREGEPALGMYIIIRGAIAIISSDGDRLLAELQAGEFFGELALLDDSPRSATAIARSPSSMLGLFQPDLFGLTERNPRLGAKVVSHLARIIGERLRKSNEQVHALEEELRKLKEERQV